MHLYLNSDPGPTFLMPSQNSFESKMLSDMMSLL